MNRASFLRNLLPTLAVAPIAAFSREEKIVLGQGANLNVEGPLTVVTPEQLDLLQIGSVNVTVHEDHRFGSHGVLFKTLKT